MIWILIFGFIFGAILGSFIKALADRSLKKVSFGGRSYCEYCKKQLNWYDLFPVLSFILLGGKCRYCKKKLSISYLLVEVVMGLLITYLFYITLPLNLLNLSLIPLSLILIDLAFKVFAIGVLLIALLTDIKKGIIPDRITYPAVILSFIFLVLFTIYKIILIFISLYNNPVGKYLLPPHSDYFVRHALMASSNFYLGVFAAILMALFFGGIIFITRGRGMGGGDLKLAIFMGLALSFPNIIIALMIAFITGSIAGIALLLFGKKHFGQTIPFGPYLTIGGIAAIFWGQQILNWYLNLTV